MVAYETNGERRNGHPAKKFLDCSDFRGICAEGDGHPADRGSLFHMVQIEITDTGAVSGKVLQAFEPEPGRARLTF